MMNTLIHATISIVKNNKINNYFRIVCEKSRNMEKLDNLENRNVDESRCHIKEKESWLQYSQDGKCDGIKKSRYVNDSINNFKILLGNYRVENLCDGIIMLFNKFSVEDLNVFIYTYFI